MKTADPRVVALIPARGGSKGLPGKNIRPFNGQPLLGWTIEAAKACSKIERVILSTDCEAIADVGRQFGALVEMRPAALGSDTASTADVVRHHLSGWSAAGAAADVVVLLQPTSPLRTAEHVREALEAFEGEDLDSLASCAPAPSHPYLTWRMQDGCLKAFCPDGASARRQDMPPAYVLNGAIYIFRAGQFPPEGDSVLFGRIGGYRMQTAVSIDIDDLDDFRAAEAAAHGPASAGMVAED